VPPSRPDDPSPNARTGVSAPRREDARFLTGRARYMDDIDVAGQAWMAVVRSNHAHAIIKAIDTGDAAALPGVLGVHTHADLTADQLGHMPCPAAGDHLSYKVVPPRPALAVERLRHVGDPVAVVIAETADAGRTAAEMVLVEADPLPANVDPARAGSADTEQIWPEAPANLAFRREMGDRAAVERAFAGATHKVELQLVNNRVHAMPMEPRAGIGEYDAASGNFTLTCNVQGVHEVRNQLADAIFGIDRDKVRIRAPDVGGGFGLKNFLYPEWILLLWAARRHGRAVKWVAGRGEDFAGAAHGRDSRVHGALALDTDGRFLALEAHITGNMGAYLSGGGPGVASRAFTTALGGIYDIPCIHLTAQGVFTNTGPVDAYRGAGKPEANFVTERLIEAAAARCGFDPVELRLKNAIDAFPHVTALGQTLDCGRFKGNIEDAARYAARDGFEARRRQSADEGLLRGLGFGCFLETSRGAVEEGAEVAFMADGTVELRLGTESQGQGHETAFIQIAAERLGLSPDTLRYVQADTSRTRMGHGHGGARSMHMGGGALSLALDTALGKARKLAAELLQTETATLTFVGGAFMASGDGPSVSLAAVAEAARGRDADGRGLDSFHHVQDALFTFPNGCHAAEVTVDPETGRIAIERYIACDDYGNLINPRLTEGQVVGGVAQGIGQAIGELVVYEADSGQLLSGSLMDYLVPHALDLPDFEVHLEGVPTQSTPLGVKGSGQAGAIAAAQTVVNAVLHALAPLGIDHLDMPLTSETVWRAIAVARAGRRA